MESKNLELSVMKEVEAFPLPTPIPPIPAPRTRNEFRETFGSSKQNLIYFLINLYGLNGEEFVCTQERDTSSANTATTCHRLSAHLTQGHHQRRGGH